MDYDCVIFIKHNTNMNYLGIVCCALVQEELQEKHEEEIQSLEVCT